MKEYCSSLTKEDCRLKTGSFAACEKVNKKCAVVALLIHLIKICNVKYGSAE